MKGIILVSSKVFWLKVYFVWHWHNYYRVILVNVCIFFSHISNKELIVKLFISSMCVFVFRICKICNPFTIIVLTDIFGFKYFGWGCFSIFLFDSDYFLFSFFLYFGITFNQFNYSVCHLCHKKTFKNVSTLSKIKSNFNFLSVCMK